MGPPNDLPRVGNTNSELEGLVRLRKDKLSIRTERFLSNYGIVRNLVMNKNDL